MKMMNKFQKLVVGLGLLALVVSIQHAVQAAPLPGRAVATSITGSAEYQIQGESQWKLLKKAMALSEDIFVRTGKGASVDLVTTTRAVVRVSADALLQIVKLSEDTKGLPRAGKASVERTELTLHRGWLLVESAKGAAGSSLLVRTPLGVVNAIGAKFIVDLGADGKQYLLSVLDGTANMDLAGGRTITVAKDQEITGIYNSKTGQCAVNPNASPTPSTDAGSLAKYRAVAGSSATEVQQQIITGAGPVDLTTLVPNQTVAPVTEVEGDAARTLLPVTSSKILLGRRPVSGSSPGEVVISTGP